MNFSFKNARRGAIGAAFVAGALIGTAGTGLAATVLGSDVFSDVPRGAYFDDAVGEMYNIGVIKGYENTDRFGPNDFVTRGQVAVMMQRFRDELNGTVDNDNDSTSSSSRSSSSRSSSSSSFSSSYNPKGTFRFTTTGYTVNENQTSVNISVVRIGGNEGSASVNYAITAGSAKAGEDYETISGTLSFASKETSKTFSMKILNDSDSEGSETATITLSNATNGAGIGSPSTATLTILDDENGGGSSNSSGNSSNSSASSNPKGTLSFAATSYMVNEAAGTATITVQRTGGSSSAVGISYATSNGTANSGNQYTSTNGTLSFGAGETTKTFTVSITDDGSSDGNKTFNITLSSVTGGATLGTPSAVVVTIHDDENATYGSGSIKLSKAEYDVLESSGKAEILVQRTGGANNTVSVTYSTTGGTATSGGDFTNTNGTLTFAPGETGKIVTIPLIKDSSEEADDEEFYFNISPGSGNPTVISPTSTKIIIAD
jgi:hypothetical protein